MTNEPVGLARRTADVVVASGVAAVGVGEAGGALRLASAWSAVSVGAQTIAAFAIRGARRAFGCAFDAAAEA